MARNLQREEFHAFAQEIRANPQRQRPAARRRRPSQAQQNNANMGRVANGDAISLLV